MKKLMTLCAFAALTMIWASADAQTPATPKADVPAASGMMMNCPMMTGIAGMQKDMGGIMSEMQAMMKDTKDPALKERMQKMQERMTAMMASMQNMGMTGNMMGGQQPGNAAPKSEATPSTPPAAAPVSPEDHEEHHPAQ